MPHGTGDPKFHVVDRHDDSTGRAQRPCRPLCRLFEKRSPRVCLMSTGRPRSGRGKDVGIRFTIYRCRARYFSTLNAPRDSPSGATPPNVAGEPGRPPVPCSAPPDASRRYAVEPTLPRASFHRAVSCIQAVNGSHPAHPGAPASSTGHQAARVNLVPPMLRSRLRASPRVRSWRCRRLTVIPISLGTSFTFRYRGRRACSQAAAGRPFPVLLHTTPRPRHHVIPRRPQRPIGCVIRSAPRRRGR